MFVYVCVCVQLKKNNGPKTHTPVFIDVLLGEHEVESKLKKMCISFA